VECNADSAGAQPLVYLNKRMVIAVLVGLRPLRGILTSCKQCQCQERLE
jgi:hypothetical protein